MADIHGNGDAELPEDKAALLGKILKEIYAAKLARQFPHSPCIAEFYEPEPDRDLADHQISFWQARHEPVGA